MKNVPSIPEIPFQNRQRKAFEFEIISVQELLQNNARIGHNSYHPHRLSFYALLIIQEGKGKHLIDFEYFELQDCSLLFIAKDQVHAFVPDAHLEGFILLFTEEFLLQNSAGKSLIQQISLYNYFLHQPILTIPKGKFSAFLDLVQRIQREYDQTTDFATKEIIQSALRILLYSAERIRKASRPNYTPPTYLEEFKQFRKLLNQYLFENRSVQFYAQQLAISTKTLNRIIQEAIQKPAKTYIDESLILEIKRLLINTDLPIKEIAFQTGFTDPTNFVKFFKKYTQITPADFKKQY